MALTDQELEYLEEFLISAATSEHCLDIASLDGFLAALAVGPVEVDMMFWLPVVWGEETEPVFESEAQKTLIKTLIDRRLKEIVQQFEENPSQYQPILYERNINGRTVCSLEEWCSGFMIAVRYFASEWQRLFDSRYCKLMIPFMLFDTEDDRDDLEDIRDYRTVFLEKWVDTLSPSLAAIYAFWRESSVDETDAILLDNAYYMTLNDISDCCPCGSGKPFKSCCGAKERLH